MFIKHNLQNVVFFLFQAKEISRIKIYRFNASLCYTNAENFVEKLYKKTICNPVEIKAARRSSMLAVKKPEPDASMVLDFIFCLMQTTSCVIIQFKY